jgi:hypothetical protein
MKINGKRRQTHNRIQRSVKPSFRRWALGRNGETLHNCCGEDLVGLQPETLLTYSSIFSTPSLSHSLPHLPRFHTQSPAGSGSGSCSTMAFGVLLKPEPEPVCSPDPPPTTYDPRPSTHYRCSRGASPLHLAAKKGSGAANEVSEGL